MFACNIFQLSKLMPSLIAAATVNESKSISDQSLKIFDFSVVDEASLISEPLLLANFYVSQRSLLIGDHMQLSPITKNEES
mmetsp:Transcript_101855/g.219921  ORF Transcript_101855/g.219921 Transcript_101855/m.219921 type:complete len:81 (-) Transcript_101855:940-1182(-)